MKDQIFGVLQRVGRSFMLPIAVLPVAGLLLGIGSSFTNATMIDTYGLQAILGEGTILNMFLTVLSKAGRGCGSFCCDRLFYYECGSQCHAGQQRTDSG